MEIANFCDKSLWMIKDQLQINLADWDPEACP